VAWNGFNRPTTFVSSTQLTAQISANDLLVAGTDVVTVSSAAAGGSASNPLTFTIPCVLANASVASAQTRARLGVYYFDGWAGPMDSYHLRDFLNSPYQDRQPLSGWRDDNRCAVEQQLAWAHSFGAYFFVFDWYFNATVVDQTEDLNSAIKITRTLPDRHGMQYAILYVNHPPFGIGPADWSSAIHEWITYMKDPAYVLVNGKPLFIVYDMDLMRQSFGSSVGVADAFVQLRAAAQAQGLSGVQVVGVFPILGGVFPDLSIALREGYDAVTMYGYAGLWPQGMTAGMQPFSILADAGSWIWSQAALKSPLPFIADVMDGWDPRPCAAAHDPACPWDPQTITWLKRTPQDLATFLGAAITWADSNPHVRVEPSPAPPIVLMEAWNELTEGSYILPTVGDGTSYGDALTAMFMAAPAHQARVAPHLELEGERVPHASPNERVGGGQPPSPASRSSPALGDHRR
jgi:hypothetical protein